MILDKGRAKPESEVEIEDSLEKKLMRLAEMRIEMKAKRNEFKKNTQHLRESIKSLENVITAEVLEKGKTIVAGNIRAEYVPMVRFQMSKETNNGE